MPFEEVLEPAGVRTSLPLEPSDKHRSSEHESARQLGLIATDEAAPVRAQLDNLERPARPGAAQT